MRLLEWVRSWFGPVTMAEDDYDYAQALSYTTAKPLNRVDIVEVNVEDTAWSGPQPTAGEYWRIAGKAAELIADLEGTDLAPHWQQSLQFLVRDAQRAAGAEAVHEVAQDGEHAHINVKVDAPADPHDVARIVTEEISRAPRRDAA